MVPDFNTLQELFSFNFTYLAEGVVNGFCIFEEESNILILVSLYAWVFLQDRYLKLNCQINTFKILIKIFDRNSSLKCQ